MADKGSMTDKKAALPGLAPPEEGEVIEFGPSAAAEDRDDRDREPEDRFLTQSASDDDEDEGKITTNIFSGPRLDADTRHQKRQSGRTRCTHARTTTTTKPSPSTSPPPTTRTLDIVKPQPGSTTSTPPSEPST